MKALMVSNPGLRRFLAAATAGALMSAAFAPVSLAQAPAADTPTPTVALPDFTSIIEKADPAVVNIRTTATVPIRGVGRAATIPPSCSAGSSAPISSRRARRPVRASVRSRSNLRSVPCRVAWARVSSSRMTATS